MKINKLHRLKSKVVSIAPHPTISGLFSAISVYVKENPLFDSIKLSSNSASLQNLFVFFFLKSLFSCSVLKSTDIVNLKKIWFCLGCFHCSII